MSVSKVQSWCEGVIEAGWLAALIVAPMFFNVYSSRVFEPDKISLVRTISLLMLLAYLVKVADGGRAWLPIRREDGSEAPLGLLAEGEGGLLARLLRIPLLLPVTLLLLAYAISTALSVAPRVSWWGSYQRLQGAYTFLSYIIIGVLTAAHLRRPEQLRRLQHTVILTSLPISIYGIIQHLNQDPLPWGGDVVTRVSANAGNPIFLGAHLIMAFFLTLERVYSSFAYLLIPRSEEEENGPSAAKDLASSLVGGSYLFVLLVQLLAIYWTGSRGPWLGLAAGMYVFVLMLLTGLRPPRYRLWTSTWVGLGALGVILLVLINVTPLGAGLRNVPYVGRLTTILESDVGTGLVRVLIWEGVSEMVKPHEPLVFPDGEPDRVNPIRPLVGYGPEAMWVAYNKFYPPALAQVEARNASPDRSHNETWDSLAITGAFGFFAYVLMFLMLFYWALRWLGLITNRRDLYLFLGLWLGGGAILSIAFYFIDGSWRFFGVALPTGFIAGFVLYVTLAVFLHPDMRMEKEDQRRKLLIVAILAAIVAHYVEIHFGIAIAATRTYFWVYSALLLALGMGWLTPEPFAAAVTEPAPAQTSSGGGRRRRSRRSTPRPQTQEEGSPALPSTVMPDLLVMLTLVYLYTTNFEGLTSRFSIIWRSLVYRMEGGTPVWSPSILFLVIFTWLIAVTVGLSVAALRSTRPVTLGWWLKGAGLYSVVLWGGWLVYALIQAGRLIPGAGGAQLTDQLSHIAGHFSLYTWLVIIWALAAGMVFAWPHLRAARSYASRALVSVTGGAVVTIVTFMIISNVNVALVKADIFYKQGQQFDSQGDWVGSIELYRRALAVRPTEDHYMLFLGRSLLEQAKRAPAEGSLQYPGSFTVEGVLNLSAQEVSQMGREDLLRAAEVILKEAQRVNPLNTDHTANLARLYRSWADLTNDPAERTAMLERSLEYYDTAVTLSPHAAHLWNERGATLTLLGREDEAEETYLHSLSLDDRFENTYLLLAELYERRGETEKLRKILEQGMEKIPKSVQLRSYLGVVQARSGDLQAALETNLDIVQQRPDDLNAVRNLAILYRDLDQPQEAITWAERAVELASRGSVDRQTVLPLLQLLADLYNRVGEPERVLAQYERMQQVAPDDPAILNNLANLYIQNGRLNDAILVLQQLKDLEPDNFQHPLRMAQLYAQLGDENAARQFGEAALALAPDADKPAIEQFLATLP